MTTARLLPALTKASFAALTVITITGCASTGPKVTQNKLTAPTTKPPVVAVLPFESPDYKKLQPQDRQVRDFERSYLPARLVQSLRRTPGIGAAYFTPSHTAAADLVVHGTIKKSDGKMTVIGIKLLGADGRTVSSQSFSVNTSSAEFRKNPDPSGRLWPQIATAIAKSKQKPGDYAVGRTVGYAKNKTIVVTDKRANVATEGASAEQRGMLEPATKQLVSRAVLADPLYLSWQRESTPLVEQRSGEKAAVAVNTFTMILGSAAMLGGAYTGNYSATTQGSTAMTMAANNIDVSTAKIAEINKTLATASQSLSTHQGQPLSVRLFGKVYTFTGSMEKQQADLHTVVQNEIAKIAE